MNMILPAKYDKNEILFISSYPPRACGIATFSTDLINAMSRQFSASFSIKICALNDDNNLLIYPSEVKYILNASDRSEYIDLAKKVNADKAIKLVFIQHEFGLFGGEYGEYLLSFIHELSKPVSITFHTVIPNPDLKRKAVVQALAEASNSIIVMTEHSNAILIEDYLIPAQKISIIAHGTHVALWTNKHEVKRRHGMDEQLVLSTFGLLSSNKSVETALDALPEIIQKFPNVLYLIIGRTHPCVVRSEGESYREFLEEKVEENGLENNVRFINRYLKLPALLEYLRLSDIYLFTSKDPSQTVSGTFAYAMSTACQVISTPIPHAKEMLKDNAGLIVDFENPGELAEAVILLLSQEKLRESMAKNAFIRTRATVWENAAVAHAQLFHRILRQTEPLEYNLPKIRTDHIFNLTDDNGMIQFSVFNKPDIDSGYTLDDNARAMISMCMHYELTKTKKDLKLIATYVNFISICQKADGSFLNYIDKNGDFHVMNRYTNLEDSNGRAVWALGFLISQKDAIPLSNWGEVEGVLHKAEKAIIRVTSPRSIAFAIKGLYYHYKATGKTSLLNLIEDLADRLVEKYNSVSDENWNWFEKYLTYANSILPEAMLCAYLATGKISYKYIAQVTFDFLLSQTFQNGKITVVSNRGWHHKGKKPLKGGEQPIDVSYAIQALDLFFSVFGKQEYLEKMKIAFSWFSGNNHLSQIMYNPLTGGCYDGLEKENVNYNQGAESAVCFLTSHLVMERRQAKEILEPFVQVMEA